MGDIIKIEHLSLKRGSLTVLREISLPIRQGEVLVVIGPSGSGKSSLLRCLNRLEVPASGRILLDGTDIATINPLDLRRKVGMVFQKSIAFEGTVADNISYSASLVRESLSLNQIRALMEKAALEPELIDKDASQLSGGQEQRLAIARTLANQPSVLLLDEPTSALDPIATHKIEETLLALRKSTNLTLIWVSHSVEQARRIADRILLLEDGTISRLGDAQSLLDPQSGDGHILAFAQGIDNDAGEA